MMIARRRPPGHGNEHLMWHCVWILFLWACVDPANKALQQEPVLLDHGLFDRGDSIAVVDLRLRVLGDGLLRYDSARGGPAFSVDSLRASEFAPKPSDLSDVWGTPIRISLSADSAVLSSAGPTRRWEDGTGISVTVYYLGSNANRMRTRAALRRDGQLEWREWWVP